jgi:serine/threonine protein kinase
MLTTDLGACEWFVWDLRRSNLIDRGELDQVIGEYLSKHPGAEPPQLAEYLVQKGVLTEFQAERLLQGKTQGFVLGPFTLTDALGTGSMGTVYKAQSKTDGGWYAVKVLPRRSMWNVRIARRKVRLFEQCKHPAVVPFTDVGTSGGMHYLAWPLVEGHTLEKVVERRGKLPPDEAVAYAIQALQGLEVCHQQGLFHGLLKPSNLMVGPDDQVRILDFGIGCLLAETEGESLVDTMSTANSVNSGLDCASPESIMDPTNLSPVGDQYSLGCVLYHSLSGKYPFPDGTAVEKMMAHQTKQPVPLGQLVPEVPGNLLAVVEQLMQKDPHARYASCTEVIDALRPFAGGAAPPPPGRKMRPSLASIKLPKRPSSHDQAVPPQAVPVAPVRLQPPRAQPPRAQPAPPRTARPAPPAPPQRIASRSARPAPPAPRPDAPVPPPPASTWESAPLPPQAPPRPPASFGQVEPPSLSQRLGTMGVVLLALLAGAVAWLLSSMVKF